jgi:protein-tyrosine phosphatase
MSRRKTKGQALLGNGLLREMSRRNVTIKCRIPLSPPHLRIPFDDWKPDLKVALYFAHYPEKLLDLMKFAQEWNSLAVRGGLGKGRSCTVCGAWFVWRRKDQICCGIKCASTLRKRRWDAKQAQYEQTRKDNDSREKNARFRNAPKLRRVAE